MANPKPKTITKLKLVEVEWEDILSSESGWLDIDTIKVKPEELLHKTAGYLLKLDKEYAVIIGSVSDVLENASSVTIIPRGAIKKIYYLKRR